MEDLLLTIFTVVGALYTGARIIVLLTPTPKDDAYVAHVGKVLRGIAKGFGLDLKQGINLDPPKAAMLIIGCSLLLGGCYSDLSGSPEAEYLAASKTYTATVQSLTDLKKANKLDEGDVELITVLIYECRDYLRKWADAVQAGKEKPDGYEFFENALDKLLYFEQKGAS
jgi:hypothetical protein